MYVDALHGKSTKLGMNASQAWSFGIFFGLILGDAVDENSQHMKLVHMLLDIVDKVFEPETTVSMTYCFDELVYQHHALFANCS